MNRRTFLGQAGAALGTAAALATRSAGGATAATTAPTTAPAGGATAAAAAVTPQGVEYLEQTGWNQFSPRFVEAPTLTWKPVQGAVAYIVQFANWDDSASRTVRLQEPTYDMSREWPSLSSGVVDLLAWPVDAQDQPLRLACRKRFYKSPGFDGVREEPADWAASIERSIAYLLAPARDEVADYERGLPRSVWSCCEDNLTGERNLTSYPALHHPSFIFAYLAYAEQFPNSAHAPEATRQAKQYADWLLANRLPADWKCGLFPFSSIHGGKFEGSVEGQNITLFRAARAGEAMVQMFRCFKDTRYLDYARHLADRYVEMQRPDGSWPYRVHPKDGKVVEEYTSNAVTPARLLGKLEQVEPNSRYAAARERAARWVMQNPVRTRRWQGMYEDIGATAPYRNLQHWDTNEMIRYLVHYHRGDAEAVRTAEELNRYIEDQFVIWRVGDRCIVEKCPAPTVLEQYSCWRPMEGHTGTWIQSLIALHRATGKDDYLVKAINAGNSILRGQQASGAYSTWGFDVRFGRPQLTLDWPGSNAVAVVALLQLMRYLDALPQARQEIQPL